MFSSIFSRDPVKAFEYEARDVVHPYSGSSFWTLHNGMKKSSGEEVSIFVYDAQKQGDSWLSAAKASLKRLKTMKHPNILTYVDGLETDKIVYMVTEPVVPLSDYLAKCSKKTDHLLAWGLLQILKGLSFLNEKANLTHHAVSMGSAFVNKAGEWKLGGLDYVTPADGDAPSSLHNLKHYVDPPHYTKGGGRKWVDMWGYGLLIYQVFNGTVNSKEALKQTSNVPEQLRPHYVSLVSASPESSPTPSDFITKCSASRGFFSNPIIDSMNFLDEIQVFSLNRCVQTWMEPSVTLTREVIEFAVIFRFAFRQLKSAEEKSRFFGKLTDLVASLPDEVCTYRVLPLLLNTFEFGPADNSTLPILLRLGKGLKDDEYQKRIIPVVVKLFSSTDRGTRMQLLQQLRFYVDSLSSSIINNQIFPNVANGFLDTNPAIREETVKSIVLLAPKLSSKNLNEEVMKHFARIQAKDEQGAIRTNTTVCIGKLAPCLVPDVRLKVLVSAFSRALRDPFTPCRVSGAVGFAVTFEYFSLKDVAARVLPSLCCALMDPDKEVREQVLKSTKLFLERMEKASDNPAVIPELESKVNAGSVNIVNTAANWAGSVVSSLTSKFIKPKAEGASEENTSKTDEREMTKVASDNSLSSARPTTDGLSSPMAPSPAMTAIPSGWDDGIDDWSFLQEKGNAPSGPGGVKNGQQEGWDDADWSSPMEESSNIPVIKPPPPAGSLIKPATQARSSPFAHLANEDIFAPPVPPISKVLHDLGKGLFSPVSLHEPSTVQNSVKANSTSASRAKPTAAQPTAKPAPPAKTGTQPAGTSWDSWDSWDTQQTSGGSSVLKPTTAAAAANKPAAAKPLKLTATKKMDLLD